MEADSLAQSVEMSAVPWPLLKLCFPVISNLREMVSLSETARKDPSRGFGRNHSESEMSGPVHTVLTVRHAVLFFVSELTLVHDLQMQKKTPHVMSQFSLLACLHFTFYSLITSLSSTITMDFSNVLYIRF